MSVHVNAYFIIKTYQVTKKWAKASDLCHDGNNKLDAFFIRAS